MQNSLKLKMATESIIYDNFSLQVSIFLGGITRFYVQ